MPCEGDPIHPVLRTQHYTALADLEVVLDKAQGKEAAQRGEVAAASQPAVRHVVPIAKVSGTQLSWRVVVTFVHWAKYPCHYIQEKQEF